MLWHFILTMTWKSTRLTHINATISRHDVLHPSEKSYAIVDDRVCLDLVLACHLFSTKVKRFVLQNFHIYTFTFYQRMSKLHVYFLNHLLWYTSATSVARWSIPQIACLLSSLVRARVSVLDASVLSLRYAAPSLHFSIRVGGCFPFSQNFRNFRFGGKWNTFRRFIPLENSQKKWKI